MASSGGGLLPGLGNISEIIQGIPQIGRLAGGLIRPLTDAAEEGIRLNMVLETAQIGFEGVAGSADRAGQHIRALQEFGKKSPFRFEGLLEASRFMTAFGFSLDEQIPKLTVWGNAIAASGELSESKIHDVVRAFGQMRLAGRVNAQDMNQLTNANIPGWELLAKAIGKTVEQTRKLSEQGKLRGPQAVEAITAMMAIDPRFKDMMKRMESTGAGRLSAAQDVLQFAQARATETLTKDISETLGAALQKEDLAARLAGTINLAITPVSGLIKNAAISLLGGGLTSGFIEGIQAGKDAVKQAVGDFALDGIIGTAKSWLGIESPSKVFMEMGQLSAEGYRDGLVQGLRGMTGDMLGGFDDLLDELEGHLQSRQKRFANVKQRSRASLDKLVAREPDFLPKLTAGARARGMDPDHILNVMAVETAGSFNPFSRNPTSSASGMIQFMKSTAPTLGTTIEAIRKMNATQQLDYVFKYFDQYIKRFGPLDTQGKVYAAVGTGRVASSDEGIVMRRGQPGYAGNAPTWDRNMDGLIKQSEMAMAAVAKLGAGIDFTVNNAPVTPSNPMPVMLVTSSRGLGRTSRTTAGPTSFSVDASFDESSIEIADPFQRLMAQRGGGALTTDMSAASLTSLIPRALADTKALGKAAMDAANATKAQILGAGQWGAEVIRQTEPLAQRFRDLKDALPSLRQEIDDTLFSLPQGMGDIFGNAVATWDFTLKGFLNSLTQGVRQTLADIAGQLASSAITKLLVSLGLGALSGGLGGIGLGGGSGSAGGLGTVFAGSFASGGTIPMGQYGYVHDNEKVIATPYGAQVIPSTHGGGGQKTEIHKHYTIQLPPDSRGSYSSPKSRRQLSESLIAALEAART
jgi:tape measure domain-containing protein